MNKKVGESWRRTSLELCLDHRPGSAHPQPLVVSRSCCRAGEGEVFKAPGLGKCPEFGDLFGGLQSIGAGRFNARDERKEMIQRLAVIITRFTFCIRSVIVTRPVACIAAMSITGCGVSDNAGNS